MRIPQETVQQIQQAADIVDVINDYVTLKKRGANLIACCPFHNEKTPSFNVNPARGIFKCFGCGKAGDAVKFVMEIEGIGYPEALRHLAKKYAIEIRETELTPEEIQHQNERESLYIALDYARKFYQEQLLETDEGQSIGLSYFRERGFNNPTIAKFELGYSPDSWDAFTKKALQQQFRLDVLEKAGLSIRRDLDDRPDGRVFDRFRARVIFPIHNLSGKVIAFGARTLKTDKNQPKYLNSPETEVYHKSNSLYGLYQAKNAIRGEEVAYLVEGYTDVISLHQAGIANVVASSGTSLTIEQIRLIGRFTQNITVLYDGDAAGIKASLRGLDLILEEGLNVKLCTFPEGEDPDSYVRKIGGEAFKAYVRQHAVDFIRFKAEVLLQDAGDDPFRRAGVIREMVDSISRIPDAITRQVFFQQTARLMDLPEETLIYEANKKLRDRTKAGSKPRDNREVPLPPGVVPPAEEGPFSEPPFGGAPFEETATETVTTPKRPPLSYQEEEFCRLLVLYGSLVIEKEVREQGEHEITLMEYMVGQTYDLEFQTPVYRRFMEIFRAASQQELYPETQFFLGHEEEEILQTSIHFVTEKHPLSENWAKMHEIYIPHERERLGKDGYACILRLKKAFNNLRMAEVKQRLGLSAESAEQEELLMQFMKMKKIDQAISKELGIIVTGY
ncbi:MAG: DNA primase [Siphonobacter aquaeclarae]|nr:DNA primase [Siphonobacter aquaeclarae]